MKNKPSIFTLQFWLLCTSSFLFFSSFNMLVPELPDYLTSMGGGDYKGLIISLFTLTAGLSRPFSGKLTDKIGRIPVMAFGSLVCFVCGFLYPISTTVMPFLLLRFVHGFSTGFKPTGTAAYIADIVPFNRRGESMGIHGLVGGLGMAFGPAIGSFIVLNFDINTLFYTSSMLSLLSIVILVNMKETLPKSQKVPFSFKLLKLNKTEIIDKAVMPVVIVIFFTSFTYGTVVTLIPDLSKSIGVANKGYFFLVYTLASIAVRFLAGKWSDLNGRTSVLLVGCIVLIASMVLVAISHEVIVFTMSAIFFGVSMGIISPISQAWTIDLCNDASRGKAVATMYIALEAGIGAGALIPTFIYRNKIENLSISFLFSGSLVIVALLYLLYYRKNEMNNSNQKLI